MKYEEKFRECWGKVKKFFEEELGVKIAEELPPIIVHDRRKFIYYTKEAQEYVDFIHRLCEKYIGRESDNPRKLYSKDSEIWENENLETWKKLNLLLAELNFPGQGHCNFQLDYLITFPLENGEISEDERTIVHEMVHRAAMKYGNENIKKLGESEYWTEYTTWLILAKYGDESLREIPIPSESDGQYRKAREDLIRIGSLEKALHRLKNIF